MVHLGIPREIKPFENRVSMTPVGVRQLIESGLRVSVEAGAGLRAGFPDADYQKAGAKIRSKASEVWKSDLVLKVKEPLPSEYRFFRPGLILFTFLHLAAHPGLERALKKKGVKAVPYEDVRDEQGRLPILTPMSEIAGCLAALIGSDLLRRDRGGKGILLTPVGGARAGRVTILGAGHVGANALRVVHGLGAVVTLYDLNREKLEALQAVYPERVRILSDPGGLPELVRETDLLIGAVLIPGKRTPRVVSASMVKSMEPGSVIVDVAIDQGGCIQTIRPTTIQRPVFLKHGVLHCGVSNLPSLAPRTATEALARATLPWVLTLIN